MSVVEWAGLLTLTCQVQGTLRLDMEEDLGPYDIGQYETPCSKTTVQFF